MDKRYYNEYFYLERNHWWFKARLKILGSIIRDKFKSTEKSNFKILNVGAATGASSIMLDEFGEVTSLEYDRDCCKYLEHKTGIIAVNASLTNLPLEDSSYDLICAFDVIEHIEDDHKAVSEIYRVLKPNGYTILTVPAFNFLWSKHDEINHHFRRYKKKNFIRLLENNQLVTIYSTYFNFLLFLPIAIIRLLLRVIPRNTDNKSSGSDNEIFQNYNIINSILFRIFMIEKNILKSKLRLPFGVSFITIGKKN